MGDVKKGSSVGPASASASAHGMFVVKRDGRTEKVHFDKITSRIKKLCYGLNDSFVDPTIVAQKVCMGVYKGVTTAELDELAAETAAHLTSEHADYGVLAARIAVSNLHKQTKKSFTDTVVDLRSYIEPKTKLEAPLIDEKVYAFIMANASAFNSAIIYDRDYSYDYFGFKTLERSYLLKINGRIVERPQHMLMRVSVGIHCGDLEAALETYNYMSSGWFTHASPTLFNGGTPLPQLSSCFLLTMKDDSIAGIYDTLKQCAMISKTAGGIGLACHNIRATGSYIRGTNGISNGLVPMLRVFNATARYVDQGGGKRRGAFAVYLEPWHADIEMWLDLKKNHGAEEIRARDLFFGLWIPDLYMKRVEANGSWSLFCPREAPGLPDCFGDEFEALYIKYENTPCLARRVVKARYLWQMIMDSQTETGTPYMLFKDACNSKSNQKNLGTIRCSNLCTEVVQFTSADEVSVCNLASVALPMFVTDGIFDFAKLNEVVQVMTRNLNKVIDVNHYPIPEAEYSNLRHRPIGIGVQGLADAFIKMRMPFDSDAASVLNKSIFETIYFGAVTASKDLAKRLGPYATYKGSPMSRGILQFDMWDVKPESKLWDWEGLRAEIKLHGVRNSLLVAPMPTASTSQILGNNECVDEHTPVTLDCGLAIPIRDVVATGARVFGWDPEGKRARVAIQSRKIDQGRKACVELTLIDGRKIVCTPDHRFLSAQGEWVEARNLEVGVSKLTMGLQGTLDVSDADEEGYELKMSTMTLTMETLVERYKMLAFARILGYVLTDGDFRPESSVTLSMGCRLDAESIARDMQLFDVEPISLTRVTDDTESCIRVSARINLTGAIRSLDGIVTGARFHQKQTLPSFLLSDACPKSVVREFLAGYFGGGGGGGCIITGGGCIITSGGCIITNNKSSRNPFPAVRLRTSVHKDHIESLRTTMIHLGTLLARVGVPGATVAGPTKVKSSPRRSRRPSPGAVEFQLTLPTGPAFPTKVGVRYCITKACRFMTAGSYWQHREAVLAQRQRVIEEVGRLRSASPISLAEATRQANDNVFANEVALAKGSRVPLTLTRRLFPTRVSETTGSKARKMRSRMAEVRAIVATKALLSPHQNPRGDVLETPTLAPNDTDSNSEVEIKTHVEWVNKDIKGALSGNKRKTVRGLRRGCISGVPGLSANAYLSEIGGTRWKEMKHYVEREGVSHPTLELRVVGRRDVGVRHVWDLSVDGDHSFVANGIMVHNCFEPYTSNLYVRRTLAGEFVCVSRHLVSDLIALGIWTPQLKNQLIAHNGSVQRLDVPQKIKDLYKTVWEISQRKLIDMAADRGAFICQSQSLNIHITRPSYGKLTSMHFHAWKRGLKTGMYYLRTKAAVDAIKFTVDAGMLRESDKKKELIEDSPFVLPQSRPFGISMKPYSSEPPERLFSSPLKPLHFSSDTSFSLDVYSGIGSSIDSTSVAPASKAHNNVFGVSAPSPTSAPPLHHSDTKVQSTTAPSVTLPFILPASTTSSSSSSSSYILATFHDSTTDASNLLKNVHNLPLILTSSLASDSGLPSPSPRSSVFSTDLAGTSKSLARAAHDDPDSPVPSSSSASSSSSSSSSPDSASTLTSTSTIPISLPSAAEIKTSGDTSTPSVSLVPPVTITTPEELAAWRAERDRQKEALYCSLVNKEACAMCSS